MKSVQNCLKWREIWLQTFEDKFLKQFFEKKKKKCLELSELARNLIKNFCFFLTFLYCKIIKSGGCTRVMELCMQPSVTKGMRFFYEWKKWMIPSPTPLTPYPSFFTLKQIYDPPPPWPTHFILHSKSFTLHHSTYSRGWSLTILFKFVI